MEVRNQYIIYIGIIVLLILCFINVRRKNNFKTGKKVLGLSEVINDPYYKRKFKIYKTLLFVRKLCLLIAVACCFVLLARPYRLNIVEQEKYSRDIILCMDISYSVDELNMELVDKLRNTVDELQGERFGIVIFNTSPVLLCPLTDDYEYVKDVLGELKKAISYRYDMVQNGGNYDMFFQDTNDWLYLSRYIEEGTLVGNEQRGSSLIGDGLAAAAYDFPDLDEDRSRVIIFSTDNDIQGEPIVELDKAADICADNNIKVFGIGTETMYNEDRIEMRDAVEKTGGKFYLQEASGTVRGIVEEINTLSKNLDKGERYIMKVDRMKVPAIVLFISAVLTIILGFVISPVNHRTFRIIASCVMVVLLVIIQCRPRFADMNATGSTKELSLKVVFVIDNTISMLAQDYNGNEERMEAVKRDCCNIIDKLEGARFSLVSFGNNAQVANPFTNDVDFAKSNIEMLTPVNELYARGTTLNVVKDTLIDLVKQQKEKDDTKLAVFFISDGEITNGDSLESFKEASKYIDYGAVLGYGTEAGGKMYVETIDSYGKEVIEDPDTYEPALSKIDEDNLNKLAKDLGLPYVHMENENDINDVVNSIDAKENYSVVNEKIRGYKEIYFWFAIPVLLCLIYERYRPEGKA